MRKSVLCSEGYPGLLGLGLGPGQLHIHPPGVETQHYARHTTICYPIHIVKLSSILPMIMKLEISGTQQLTKLSPPYSSPTKLLYKIFSVSRLLPLSEKHDLAAKEVVHWSTNTCATSEPKLSCFVVFVNCISFRAVIGVFVLQHYWTRLAQT